MVHTAKNLYRKQGFTSHELDFISIELKCRMGVLLTTVEVLEIINLATEFIGVYSVLPKHRH